MEILICHIEPKSFRGSNSQSCILFMRKEVSPKDGLLVDHAVVWKRIGGFQTQRIRLTMAEQPDWRPIRRLPLIESMIDGMLQTGACLKVRVEYSRNDITIPL
jgi:hypothetical protein